MLDGALTENHVRGEVEAIPYWHPTDLIGRIKRAIKRLAKPRKNTRETS